MAVTPGASPRARKAVETAVAGENVPDDARILAVNAGSSSLKVALYRAEQGSESLELRAEAERIGAREGRLRLAEALGARLYALYAVDMPRAFHVGIHFGEAVAELKRFGRGAVAAVRKIAERRGLECKEIVAEGSPHESIILVSNEIGADLVVVGSTGMSGLERILIGSVSQKVLLYSERPVLLVREP